MASMDKSKFMLSQDFVFEACGLIYRKWSVEYDLLKKVKAETKVKGEPDWELMHAERLRRHTQTEAKWRRLKDEAADINARMMQGKSCEEDD